MEPVVAIDIETTGLEPERDAIIEIGAVKFRGSRVESEWSSLVNPRRHVPEFITTLTGIDDAMLRQAPKLEDIVANVQAFVGQAPLLGHNVRFDLGFLGKSIPSLSKRVVDTYELAAVVLPSAGRYNLGALGKELGVLLPATHRALDDAKLTHAIYLRLLDLARQLPRELVREIARLSAPLNWDAGVVFEDLMRSQAAPTVPGPGREGRKAGLEKAEPPPSLEVTGEPRALDADEVAAVLEPGGRFSRHFQSYEYRSEQVQMLRAVTDSLSNGRHLMVEAGTGVGKSFAYLIPAALFATKNHTRVLVSTNTINLQDQLIRKDIPDLEAALNLGARAAILKGRSNYLCPRRLENARRAGPRSQDEMRVLAKVLVWQLQDEAGDKSSLNLNGNAERDVWLRLSAEDEGCTTETCIRRKGGACPFHRARSAAQSAHLLVVNHALLLSDAATEGRILPDYAHLIVDEAHHLEAATTDALSFHLTQFDFERLLKDVGGSASGVLGSALALTRRSLPRADFGPLKELVARATDSAFQAQELVREFFSRLSSFASGQRDQEQATAYAWQARILPATRTLPGWDAVDIAWDSAAENLGVLLRRLSEAHKSVSTYYTSGEQDLEDLVADMATIYRRLSETAEQVSAMISKPKTDQVYWIEVRPSGTGLSLNAAPLQVGPLIEKVLWHEKASVIVTSATLTTHGEFHYLRNALGADEAEELQLGSPFDYESSTLLYVANDVPEPNSHDYPPALHRALIATARASEGRMLALFTSYAALRRAAQAIASPLANSDIAVYQHGQGASPNALLESFKSSERAVLLGTRSFWEGVDVPGSALSVLFIARLPFGVPTDPLIAARSETYEDPFQDYYLPEAILRFRQGFGRLIRTASDRGVVAILDRRILSKQYGRFFLESLPQCTMRSGPASQMARETASWLGT
jgi:DNA polymerase-3 subunit epsilon/ATP-dependent DNA helicase DinG